MRSHAQKVLSDYSIANRKPTAQSEQLNRSSEVNDCSSKKNSEVGTSHEVAGKIYTNDFVEPQHLQAAAVLGKRAKPITATESIQIKDQFKPKRQCLDDSVRLTSNALKNIFMKPLSSHGSSSRQSM